MKERWSGHCFGDDETGSYRPLLISDFCVTHKGQNTGHCLSGKDRQGEGERHGEERE